MKHPGVRLLVVTGGPGVVKAAMNSGKKVIAAGPGNPPAVVDETANLDVAAHEHRARRVDRQQHHLHRREGGHRGRVDRRRAQGAAGARTAACSLNERQLRALEKVVLHQGTSGDHPNKDFVGKNAGGDRAARSASTRATSCACWWPRSTRSTRSCSTSC